mgnify:CR=1 FL=1
MYNSSVASYVKSVQPTDDNGFNQMVSMQARKRVTGRDMNLCLTESSLNAALPSGFNNFGYVGGEITYTAGGKTMTVINFMQSLDVSNLAGNGCPVEIMIDANIDFIEWFASMKMNDTVLTGSFTLYDREFNEIPLGDNQIMKYIFSYYSLQMKQIIFVSFQVSHQSGAFMVRMSLNGFSDVVSYGYICAINKFNLMLNVGTPNIWTGIIVQPATGSNEAGWSVSGGISDPLILPPVAYEE